MVLSFYGRCCLLGLALISAANLDFAAGQLGNETTTAQFELLYEKIIQLTEKVDELGELLKTQLDDKEPFISQCQIENERLICQTNSSGAGWIVMQQRFDGTVNFNRNWRAYRDGFGTVGENSEFWWGLERVHQLTKTGNYELLMEFKDDRGEYRFVRYSDFVVEGESKKYRLAKLGGYSGTAGDINSYGDSYIVPTGRKFTTYDNDNDFSIYRNCASDFGGGWWFGLCGFGPTTEWKNWMRWQVWKNEPLRYSRMLIRVKV